MSSVLRGYSASFPPSLQALRKVGAEPEVSAHLQAVRGPERWHARGGRTCVPVTTAREKCAVPSVLLTQCLTKSFDTSSRAALQAG